MTHQRAERSRVTDDETSDAGPFGRVAAVQRRCRNPEGSAGHLGAPRTPARPWLEVGNEYRLEAGEVPGRAPADAHSDANLDAWSKAHPCRHLPRPGGHYRSRRGFQSSTNGWEFKPTVDIKVTDLGYVDDRGDGLRHPHPVGGFDTATKKLLVKTTVQRMSPLDGAYRFAKIQPLTLTAGKAYMMATVSYPPFDPEVDGPAGLVFAPEIEYRGYRETLTDKFVYPAPSGYQFITANFRFAPAP